jgi:hypothetical protein
VSPKRGGEPKRKISDTAKRLSILAFTEGKKTEPTYFTHWSRAYREKVIVTKAKPPPMEVPGTCDHRLVTGLTRVPLGLRNPGDGGEWCDSRPWGRA